MAKLEYLGIRGLGEVCECADKEEEEALTALPLLWLHGELTLRTCSHLSLRCR
jgi:hypothetical protein